MTVGIAGMAANIFAHRAFGGSQLPLTNEQIGFVLKGVVCWSWLRCAEMRRIATKPIKKYFTKLVNWRKLISFRYPRPCQRAAQY